jgi:hypothetical protein
MQLADFVCLVPNFSDLPYTEQVRLLVWYLHTHQGIESVVTADVRKCYTVLSIKEPNVSDTLINLASKKPPILLRNGQKYRLTMKVRQELDRLYLNQPIKIPIEKMLEELPGKIPNEAERKYLTEAILCYRVEAYRGAIVLAWQLAYAHLTNWILSDAARLAIFNRNLPNKEPFRSGSVISKREDFEELKESETISICAKTNLITHSQKTVLEEKLRRRNSYAHPNSMEVSFYRVGDHICDLVNNIILQLQ